MKHYDVIVIGTGGVGSAALYHLAARGVRALGLDRFPIAHDRGSSHGESRIIRLSYFEHAGYVPLLKRSYELWDALAQASGRALLHRVGILYVGAHDRPIIHGVRDSATAHQLDVTAVDSAALSARFPGFQIPKASSALFEQDAGYLLVEDCVRAHAELAIARGAEHSTGHTVRGWRYEDGRVIVDTDAAPFSADRLILSAGPWSNALLASLDIRLRVLRKHLHWFETNGYKEADGCPTFFYDTPNGYYYGFPKRDALGLKVAEHSRGVEVDDPLNDPRAIDPDELERVKTFLRTCLPGVSTRHSRHEVCFYTMSPDENFIVDRHPDHPEVVFAAGLSGHGFKMTAALGEALVELALDGTTSQPIGFLGLSRLG
jgi:monomeric sarcosine oxidase